MGLGALVGLGFGALAMGALHQSLRPLFNEVNQSVFSMLPNELLPPASMISMVHRGLLSEVDYNESMRKQGLDGQKAGLLLKDSLQLFNAYELIALWRRDGISDSDLDQGLEKIGWAAGGVDNLKMVSKYVPNAQDIIAFAVREVYSPQIAEAFGQFEGVERVMSEAETDIKAAGMDPETFRKFWAAHWQLPSMGQGYEMLHRKIIDDGDIDKLMEAMDIMPWWRPKLKAMSFSAYTRVDVRRMHKLGILSESELVVAYQDLGYDKDKAEGLKDFTIAYNRAPIETEQTEDDRELIRTKEVTRSAVTKSYRNGLITQGEAMHYLGALGYTVEAVELYIANEDFALADDIQGDKLATIKQSYIRRIFDFQTTIARLNDLNLPALQTEALIDRWTIDRDARVVRPSKKELFSFHKDKLLSDTELRDELAGLGYNERYINMYVKGVLRG